MSEKVKLPREVAEAIEYLRAKGETTADIVTNCFGNANSKPYSTIKGFWDTHQDFERLLKALVNGYEVEQTPEEIIKQLYNHMVSPQPDAYRNGIIDTLNTLNIKIKGVND